MERKTKVHVACSHVHYMSYYMSQLPVYRPWHAPAKIKRGDHFCVLTGMWVFQNIALHRATNSAKSQAKIRFAFHFVKRKYRYIYLPQKQEFWLAVYSRSNLIGGPYIHLPLNHWAAHNIPQMHWLQCGFFTKKKTQKLILNSCSTISHFSTVDVEFLTACYIGPFLDKRFLFSMGNLQPSWHNSF